MVGVLFYTDLLPRIRSFSVCSSPCLFRFEYLVFSFNRAVLDNFC